MKIILSFIISTLPLGIFAQSERSQPLTSKVIDQSVFESQRDQLRTFVQIFNNTLSQEANGDLPPCSAANVVFGMGAGLAKSQLEVRDSAIQNLNLRNEIAYYSNLVSQIIANAKQSECAPAPNNLCCQKSADPATSDACNISTTYCRLMGVRIQGCTSISDDC